MILLDLDGPCADFVGGALRVHGSRLTHADITRYDMASVMGIDDVTFWRVIDEAGPEFWANLDVCTWFDQLWAGLRSIGRVVIATKPSWSWHCVAGKKQWLDRVLGRRFRDYSFTPDKDLFARPTRCLVDDSPENVASFLAAGGEAVLFPGPWNGSPMPTPTDIDQLIARVRSKLG